MQIALAIKLMRKPKRNPELEKKVASAPVGDVLKHKPKKCSKCLKKNHFARACRSDKVLAEKVNQVGDSSDEEGSDENT